MAKTFLIADTHFGHANILTFLRQDGSPLRGGFHNIHHHDEVLMENWNNVVKPEDKVYHLGDVGFKNFEYMKRVFDYLNGTKILIKGNHDNLKLSQYAQMFKDVRATHTLDKFVLSHIPLHPDSMYRWIANIHGHVHANSLASNQYVNVSVEAINYTPVNFEEIRERFNG
jgi:calcineurin-like phosphoesterase family protein